LLELALDCGDVDEVRQEDQPCADEEDGGSDESKKPARCPAQARLHSGSNS
jgi:hypothetical protein